MTLKGFALLFLSSLLMSLGWMWCWPGFVASVRPYVYVSGADWVLFTPPIWVLSAFLCAVFILKRLPPEAQLRHAKTLILVLALPWMGFMVLTTVICWRWIEGVLWVLGEGWLWSSPWAAVMHWKRLEELPDLGALFVFCFMLLAWPFGWALHVESRLALDPAGQREGAP